MARSAYQSYLAWRKAFALSVAISESTRNFPKEERYSLTDQIRRSSRSVCANLAEAYAKRIYPKHWTSKITDCAGENYETQTWLAFALSEKYITKERYHELNQDSQEVGRLLSHMLNNPHRYR